MSILHNLCSNQNLWYTYLIAILIHYTIYKLFQYEVLHNKAHIFISQSSILPYLSITSHEIGNKMYDSSPERVAVAQAASPKWYNPHTWC